MQQGNEKKYAGQVEIKNDDVVKVRVWNQEGKVYEGEVTLRNVKGKTVQLAISGRKEQLSIRYEERNGGEMLEIVITVHLPFIHPLEEVLQLPLVQNLSAMTMLFHRAQEINKKIASLQVIRSKIYTYLKQKKFYVPCQDRLDEYNEAQHYQEGYEFTELCDLNLTRPGNYFIQLSMFLKASYKYIQLYRNKDYSFEILPSSLIHFASDKIQPISISFHYHALAENMNISFQLYDVVQCPCQISNLIVTAEALQ